MSVFQLTFYKNLNAFEIYKCNASGQPDCISEIYATDSKEWEFQWNDSLKISWHPVDEGVNHCLRFETTDGHVPDRQTPIEGYDANPEISLHLHKEIIFKEHLHPEAHWSFNFCWGESGLIDPTAKIKAPGHIN